jgi:2-polyprenyl-6-methoxyphenol hydroxylase-like FAD-dependent oxidoreductase
MNALKNKKIAIIGGGPGGLTLARILQMNGAGVNVYERDAHKDARPKGATLDLHEESGLMAIQAAGLMDAFRAHYRPGADKLRIIDKHAHIIHEDSDDKNDRSRPEIDRGPLQQLLLDSLSNGTVVWDSQFVSMAPSGSGWQIKFKNAMSVYADIVIGADGGNSKIRPYLTLIKAFYAGVTIVEGVVYHSEIASPQIHKLLNGGKIFALSDGKTLIVSSKGDGSLVFYTGMKTSANWSRECGIDFGDIRQVADWFKREYAGWNDIWAELFDNATPPFVVRPQYCMPLDQSWDTLPNVTILGDAAHLMPPYAGEGVNMAMLDALELGQCLTDVSFSDAHSAISAYETQMRLRASETARLTLESTNALHSADAIRFMQDVIS